MKDRLKHMIEGEIKRLRECTVEDTELPRSRLVSLTAAEFSLDCLLDFLNEEEPERGPLAEGRDHLTEAGEFRSDKYPDTPDGILPLKLTDKMAWPMLRAYAAARVGKDIEFTRDLDEALDKVGAPSMSHFLAQGEDDAGGSIGDRARQITDEVAGKMEDKELGRMHPSSPWDRQTIVSFIRAAALMGLAESREIVEGLQSPSAIADMMTALVGTLDQMEDVLGLPAEHEVHNRRRKIEDEVLRLSRKVE